MLTKIVPFALAFLVACGGGTNDGGVQIVAMPPDPDPDPDPDPVIIPDSLGDTSITQAQAVRIITSSANGSGSFVPSSQLATFGTTTIDALPQNANSGLAYTRLLENGGIAYIETTGNAPTGTATFSGQGAVLIVDASNGADQYEGIMNASLSLNLNGFSEGTLVLNNFQGTRLSSLGSDPHSGGEVTISGITATRTGLTGVDGISISGFGGTDLSGAQTLDVQGEFAGPNFAEVVGTIDVSQTVSGSTLVGNFAGSQ